MASLREIAQAAGVSIRTVSRALNRTGYVGPDSRKAIEQAVRQLGYSPNRYARSLRTRSSYEVAVLLWSVDELHMAKIASFEQHLREAGYSVMMFFGRSDKTKGVQDLLNEVISYRPAGVAAFAVDTFPVVASVSQIEQAGIPVVVFDTREPVDSVRIDRQQGVYEAVHYLARSGRRRIAYLGAMGDSTRLEGYHRAMAELGREPIYILASTPTGKRDKLIASARKLAKMDPRPDAVQAFSDELAMHFLAGLHEAGLRVPQDVALVGFDDRRIASLSWPALTTVAQPNREVGQSAAKVLLAKIAGQTPPPGGWTQSIATRLVVREST